MEWNLCGNQIDDRGVSALIDCLPSLFPSLDSSQYHDGIRLTDNLVSSGMMEGLKRSIKEVRYSLSFIEPYLHCYSYCVHCQGPV